MSELNSSLHLAKAQVMRQSLDKLIARDDGEVIVETLMIAATHLLNAVLHTHGDVSDDQRHADKPIISVELSSQIRELLQHLREVEKIRERCVRGGEPCLESEVKYTLMLYGQIKALVDGIEEDNRP